MKQNMNNLSTFRTKYTNAENIRGKGNKKMLKRFRQIIKLNIVKQRPPANGKVLAKNRYRCYLFEHCSCTCSCVASNQHGKSRGRVILTGNPTAPEVESQPIGTERDKYTAAWSVNSHSSIIEFLLFYRQQPRHHQTHHLRKQEDSNDFRAIKANGTRMGGIRPDWVSLVGVAEYCKFKRQLLR